MTLGSYPALRRGLNEEDAILRTCFPSALPNLDATEPV